MKPFFYPSGRYELVSRDDALFIKFNFTNSRGIACGHNPSYTNVLKENTNRV